MTGNSPCIWGGFCGIIVKQLKQFDQQGICSEPDGEVRGIFVHAGWQRLYGDLWVIDYKYSEDERRPFLRPSDGKMTHTDEYQRENGKIMRPDPLAQDPGRKRKEKKGLLERLFGWL